jgi:hypothetical protein
MSGVLSIVFAPDMPPASVEVVSATEFRTFKRVMIQPGEQRDIEGAPDNSFLRVHLPSGRVVTITADKDQWERVVSRETLDATIVPAPKRIARTWRTHKSNTRRVELLLHELLGWNLSVIGPSGEYTLTRSWREYFPLVRGRHETHVVEFGASGLDVSAVLLGEDGPIEGLSNWKGDEATWVFEDVRTELPFLRRPSLLRIAHASGTLFYAIIPGNAIGVGVRTSWFQGEAPRISVRLASTEPCADAILNYLALGDLTSAESMQDWAKEALNESHSGRQKDPYAVAAGLYLLLKLRNLPKVRDWPLKVINEEFLSYVPDGFVLLASERIGQVPRQTDEIRQFFTLATKLGSFPVKGLPVYSQGLRLLLDGLSYETNDGGANQAAPDQEALNQEALNQVRNRCGAVLWNSPVTAGIHVLQKRRFRFPAINYDVRFDLIAQVYPKP